MNTNKSTVLTIAVTALVLFGAAEYLVRRAPAPVQIHKLAPMQTSMNGDIATTGHFSAIGMEGHLDSTGGRLAFIDKPFKISGSTTDKFQATISYRTDDKGCSPQALMLITIDGVQAYRVIQKLTQNTTADTIFVSYTFNVPVTKGNAVLHVETDGGCHSDWEIQGALTTK